MLIASGPIEIALNSLDRLTRIAQWAGEAVMSFYGEPHAVTTKEDGSPVTAADRAAHDVIAGELRDWDAATPIISEEDGIPAYEARRTWRRWWLVDPLDGTKEFLAQNGEFTINIALLDDGEPVLGVVLAPALQTVYMAGRGLGAWKSTGAAQRAALRSDDRRAGSTLRVVESRSHASAYAAFKSLCMLWSIGKDSTVLLWLARKALFGHVPFPLVHIDTAFKIPEMIEYRDRMVIEWNLNLIYGQNTEALASKRTFPDGQTDRLACCGALKTEALTKTLSGEWPRYKFNHVTRRYEQDPVNEPFTGVIVGARADEEGSRSKERYFSPRTTQNAWEAGDQPPEFWNQHKTDFAPGTHVRIHPLLDWTELNIWEYIEHERIPVVDLYLIGAATDGDIDRWDAGRAPKRCSHRRERSPKSSRNCERDGSPTSPKEPGGRRMPRTAVDSSPCAATVHGQSRSLRVHGAVGQDRPDDEEPPDGYGAAAARMDFSEYDRIDEDALNRILWHSIKGADAPYPAPVRRVLPTPLGLFRFPAEAEER